jgi:hypothetical protein
MNYVDFMRKLEGKEPQHDTGDSTTSGPRPLDLQGIIEFTRGNGYPHDNLEARPEVPDDRADIFWAGYDGNPSFSATMGMYRGNSSCFYWAGREYQRQQGDTHSQQQDSVPDEPEGEYVRSDWVVNGDDGVNLDEIRRIIRSLERYSVGRETPQAQPREEPEGLIQNGDRVSVSIRSDGRVLCSTIDTEESGVQGVRDEREGSERSAEDTWESDRRRLERGEGW